MNNHKVSIIIPIFNTEKFISRCLDSIINQTYNNIEIIVVNDYTLDNSINIVADYVKRDSRIKVIEHKINRGLMMTRNTGINNATGDYIMFCDSDDFLPLNSVEFLLNEALKNRADITVGSYQRVNTNGKYSHICKPKLSFGSDPHSIYKSLLGFELSHSLWGKIFKTNLLKDNSYEVYENFTNSEDRLLFYQVVQNINCLSVVDEVVYYYCSNINSSTRKNFSEKSLKNILITLNHNYIIFKDNEELLIKYKKNILDITIDLTKSHNIKSKEFIAEIDILENRTLYSFNNMKRLYKGKQLILNYCILNSKIIAYFFAIKNRLFVLLKNKIYS